MWKEIGQTTWDKMWPDRDVDLVEGDSIEGVFSGSSTVNKKNSDKKYNVHTLSVDGRPVGVWGTKVLDRKMEMIEVSERIKITYLGTKEGKEYDYKDFKVERWENEANKELDEARDRTIPSPLDKGLPPLESL